MRVLTIVTDFGIGGTQRVAQNLTLGVQREGAEVAVFAHRGRGPREAFYRERGVPVFAPGDPGEPDAHLQAALAWYPDIVHIHRSGYPAEGETRLMQAFSAQDARIVETNVFARYDRTEARNLIDVHCLLSRWCQVKWTMWRGGSDRSAATILPNAVEVADFARVSDAERQATRAELGISPSRFLFGRIGQPNVSKWSPKILDAFARAQTPDTDLGLLLVGAPKDYAEKIAALPADLRDRIILLDPIADDARLRALFTAMDAFLHLAHIGESFGMVLCEALLCGTPVITLSTPLKDNSQLEVVGHERGGLVARDLDGVVEAMARIRTDTALRDRVRDDGRAWVAERFGVERVAATAMAIYRALLASDGVADLQRRLDALEGAPPDLAWIRDIQRHGLGAAPTVRDRALFRLLHVPQVYTAYQAIKGRLARARG